MSKYNTLGGMRIKHSGKVTKEVLLKRLEIALSSFEEDFGIESFSGVNLYIQAYDKDGEKLALINEQGDKDELVDITKIDDEFTLKDDDRELVTVKELQIKENIKRIERERQQAIQKQQFEERAKREREEKEELDAFRAFIRETYNAKRLSDITTSVGKIDTLKGMLKHINHNQIPVDSYVYRASMKDKATGEPTEIRIYDRKFTLIAAKPA